MHSAIMKIGGAVFGCFVLASISGAQLVVGVDNDVLDVMLIDVNDPSNPIPLYSGGDNSPWAMAANDPGRELYFVDQDVLFRVPYDTLVPESIGQIRNPQGSLIDMTGLAFDASGQTLLGSRTVGGDDNPESPEAIYKIDTTTAVATVQFDFIANDYEFGGLDFDNATGKLYGVSDDLLPHGRGLYEIDMTNQLITQVVPYPDGESDIDGLAIDDGVAYFVIDQPGDFYSYDIATGILDTLPSPWTMNYLFSAAAWAPGLLSASGDFNADGTYDCNDVDPLVAEIVAGTNSGDFDLTADGFVNSDDLDAWLAEAGAAELPSGNAYLFGDANLDGSVDGLDFIEWNENKFTATPEWCSGDFNADGFVDGQDFVIWNQFKFQTANDVTSLPEPSTAALLILAFAASVSFKRSLSD